MKPTIILLLIFFGFCLASCKTISTEDIPFTSIPSSITDSEAIKVLHTAALKRKWTVSDIGTHSLKAELIHRGYHSVLYFTFLDTEIRYSDATTFTSSTTGLLTVLSTTEDLDKYISNSHEETRNCSVPRTWINNLKNDVNIGFRAILLETKKDISTSSDLIAEKLISLKKLKNQNLITELEYQKKREEILSEY